ncbi:RHS domain-containing protein [Gilvimarinus agarilyticus]|uniref:RHS repeat-associated core domain-containing protein n=1 Tax=Gilvimarinus sp. 2_MG-2023 TaxID=3062666 RepID=UPI001C09D20E|nr:RHS repeat-associated core domain-containing protein [Gilvimarinus sp. 2_MG-2023]MBU2887373.1 RHS domain-containing protein [Gilvimarinus agarilyticus]MDO6572032.1 RHS repeat-associated core domain-containing protein [Gilvimarinus sp. 2_MG-2023]
MRTTFTYKTNGHTVTKTTGSETTEYIYNHEERLIAVKKNGAIVGEYDYNPLGQRIKKTVNGQTTWYLYNDEGLAAEYDGQGNLIAEYQFTPYSTWMTEPLFQRRNGPVYYYQNDYLGTPQRMVNASGEVVWEARYSAFGEVEIVTENVTNNLWFPGQYFDGKSGLHHNYFRDYDSGIGRYLQRDPIGLGGRVNVFLMGTGVLLFGLIRAV